MRDLKHLAGSTEAPSRWMRFRVVLLGMAFIATLGTMFARAAYLQVHQGAKLKAYAEDQYVREMQIPARRGDIFDRRGVALAQSADVESIWADPSQMANLKEGARSLARALHDDASELRDRLEKGRRFAWVKRQAMPKDAARVRALQLPGVYFVKEPKRFYPQRELAAHLLGFVGTDGRGLDGLELSFEAELSGDPVKLAATRDAKGRKLLTEGLPDPRAMSGASIALTIDRQLQNVAEKAIQHALIDAQGIAGTVVMLDPRTGEVLALANTPRFNPNSPKAASPEAFRNRAVTDAFEPGSTLKAMVMAGAIESKRISLSSKFNCEQGAYAVGRNIIHDTKPHGILSPLEIMKVSSNIGMTKIAELMGRDLVFDSLSRFGFGERTTLGLPSEAKGTLVPPRSDIALATYAFGQGLTATALQIAVGFGTIANGGVRMRPYLVSKIVDADGVVLAENRPEIVQRAVSEATAQSVTSMLEAAVEAGGTGTRAKLEDYRVAGKTGTAQKADPVARGYSEKRIASFAGFVPAENPRVVIVVAIDEPKTDTYGGVVAAPAFREIAEATLAYLAVPPSRSPQARPAATSQIEVLASAGHIEDSATPEVVANAAAMMDVVPPGEIRVPDLTGASARTAVGKLLGISLEPRVFGSGWVASQLPVAGSFVSPGSEVALQLTFHH